MRTRFRDPAETWTEDDARLILDEWRRSGETIAGFARARSMSAPRLYWWRRRLSPADAGPSPTSLPTSLVPATILPSVEFSGAVVIRLRNGLMIEVATSSVSPTWLGALVEELARSRS